MKGRRDLVLPHLNVPGFVDSPWETLLFRRSGWGQVGGRCTGAGGGEGEDTVVGM